MLAEIFQLRRFDDELVDLIHNIKLLIFLEVATVQLLYDAIQNLNSSGILRLRVLGAISAFGFDAAISSGSRACYHGTDGITIGHEL